MFNIWTCLSKIILHKSVKTWQWTIEVGLDQLSRKCSLDWDGSTIGWGGFGFMPSCTKTSMLPAFPSCHGRALPSKRTNSSEIVLAEEFSRQAKYHFPLQAGSPMQSMMVLYCSCPVVDIYSTCLSWWQMGWVGFGSDPWFIYQYWYILWWKRSSLRMQILLPIPTLSADLNFSAGDKKF